MSLNAQYLVIFLNRPETAVNLSTWRGRFFRTTVATRWKPINWRPKTLSLICSWICGTSCRVKHTPSTCRNEFADKKILSDVEENRSHGKCGKSAHDQTMRQTTLGLFQRVRAKCFKRKRAVEQTPVC